MALTRALLKGLGIEEDKITTIIEAHQETVSGLKNERDEIQKKLDDVNNSGWEKKYNDLNDEFTKFKNQQTEKEARGAKETAFREMLKSVGVKEDKIASIMKISDIDSLKVNKDGTLHDVEKLTESAKTEWADFIVSKSVKGADVSNPPSKAGGNKMTKDEIMKITDRKARREAIKANPQEFLKGEN